MTQMKKMKTKNSMKIFITILFIFTTLLSAENIDIDKLVKVAKKTDKHLFVFLHKPYCGFCKRMIKDSLEDEWCKAKIDEKFIFVDIDIRDKGYVKYKNFKGTKHEFAKHLGYDFYPTSIFLDKNNEVIYVQPGYQNEMNLLDILEFVSTNSYKEMDIEDFKYKVEHD